VTDQVGNTHILPIDGRSVKKGGSVKILQMSLITNFTDPLKTTRGGLVKVFTDPLSDTNNQSQQGSYVATFCRQQQQKQVNEVIPTFFKSHTTQK
jgi:hypothetical protein